MLFFIAAWTILSAACLLPGLLILNLTNAACLDRVGDRLIVSLWLGAVILGVLLMSASFFFPLSPVVAIFVWGLTAILSLLSPPVRRELKYLLRSISIKQLLALFIIQFVIAAFMMQLVVCIDAGLYHIQSIKWLSEYGTVPGVALIHARFGFISSWFALAAPFHYGSFTARANAVMAGVGLTWLLIHGLFLSYRFWRSTARYEDWFIVTAYLICLPYILGLNFAVSSSPDLPVISLIIVVAWLILTISNREDKSSPKSVADARLAPLILSAGAIAVKLTAAPLFIVSLLFYLQGREHFIRRLAAASVIGSVLIVPVLISGLITSGCALFPSPFLCLDLPWSVGAELAGKVNLMNQSYERWRDYTTPPAFSWIIPWIKLNPDSVIFIVVLIIGGCFIIFSEKLKLVKGKTWIFLLAALGVSLVLLSVPSRRFALGYFTLLPALVAPFYRRIAFPLIFIFPLALEPDWAMRKTRFVLLVVGVLALLYLWLSRSELIKVILPHMLIILSWILMLKIMVAVGASNIATNGKEAEFWLLPPAVKKTELEIWEEKTVNDFHYIQSMRPYPDGRCWAAELPCTPWLLYENIRLRDPQRGLAAGIRRVEE